MRFADLNCSRLLRAFSILLFLTTPGSILAQSTARKPGPTPAVASGSIGEQRAARALESVRQNPLELRDFLVRMPKGADLHNHLAGAVYAESWIRDGADDKLCVDLDTLSLLQDRRDDAQHPAAACLRRRPLPRFRALLKISISTIRLWTRSRCAPSFRPPASAATIISSTRSQNSKSSIRATPANGSTKFPPAPPRRTSNTSN